MLDVTAELMRPKIDTHCHVWPMVGEAESARQLIMAGQMLGITEYWCSAPVMQGMGTLDEIRAHNDTILRCVDLYPEHLRGMCFVVPGFYQAAMAEVKRCLDAGMVGVKLYHQYKINDPVMWPLIELCIERHAPILMHAGYITDPSQLARQPLISHGADFAAISERYPEAVFINAHIGGGGDWEWTVRALRNASPNVYVDIAGSNLDDGQVESAVRQLGVERVLFSTDGTMAGCVGKVAEATLSPDERQSIYWGNAERILAAQGRKPLAQMSPHQPHQPISGSQNAAQEGAKP